MSKRASKKKEKQAGDMHKRVKKNVAVNTRDLQVACAECDKSYKQHGSLITRSAEHDPHVTELLSMCPHCKYELHVMYTTPQLEDWREKASRLRVRELELRGRINDKHVELNGLMREKYGKVGPGEAVNAKKQDEVESGQGEDG